MIKPSNSCFDAIEQSSGTAAPFDDKLRPAIYQARPNFRASQKASGEALRDVARTA